MENIDGFSVERSGENIIISFYDLFGQGESYILPQADGFKIKEALEAVLGPVDNHDEEW